MFEYAHHPRAHSVWFVRYSHTINCPHNGSVNCNNNYEFDGKREPIKFNVYLNTDDRSS